MRFLVCFFVTVENKNYNKKPKNKNSPKPHGGAERKVKRSSKNRHNERYRSGINIPVLLTNFVSFSAWLKCFILLCDDR